jgi:hypothetical protein
MGDARDDFLRRYATSPIHVPRLERLLDAYGGARDDDAFARRFIAWDCACPDPDAARIVTEIISVCVGPSGRVTRLSDEILQGAIRWMVEATSLTVADRADKLREVLSSAGQASDAYTFESFARRCFSSGGWTATNAL